ncbi:MAG: SsrA-binding protein SmpB [Verrucomicrobiales bacterium]|nr:SsrA-binding protein SmpB [Verrucomicrobiales bacterium]
MAKSKKKTDNSSVIASNKKARHDFQISDTYEAGIELRGTEVKSIREGKINLRDAFCRIDKDEAWLYNCDIRPYDSASHEQHEPRRNRKLLLHRREIERMKALTEQKGATLVALKAYWKNRRVKIEIGVGKGKTHIDRRDDLKKQVQKREADREMAKFNRR